MAVAFHEKIKQTYEAYKSAGWYSDLSEQMDSFIPTTGRKACVLFCIREDSQGVIHVLLTVRSNTVSTHKGEVCLPGGMVDSNDSSLLHTALREAEEETNIKSSQVYFVGFLPEYLSKYGHMCSCVLVTLAVDMHELQLQPNTAEVSHIFWMPLKIFLGGGPYYSRCQFGPVLKLDLNFFDYKTDGKDYTVWGLTAILCIIAAMIVYQFPTHFPCTPLCIITNENYNELIINCGLKIPNGFYNNCDIFKSKL